jgi:hypothetical protein
MLKRVRIDTSGNLLVGTTTDFGGRLTLIPAVTPTTFAGGNQLQIGEATNNTAYRLQMGYINDPVQGYVGSLQAYAGSVPTNLCLQGDGGNVIVGGATSFYGTSGRGLIETNGATSAINALKVGGTAIAYFAPTHSATRDSNNGGISIDTLVSGTSLHATPNVVNTSGNVTASVDMRAPIFYDSNNTAYYVDPNSISQLYGLAIRGDATPSGTQNQLFLWDAGNTTTSAIGFKSNAGAFTNPTGQGDGYNTYLTMDGAGRGWVFRRGVGGTDFTAAFTSGWILNNGLWQAQASMRAPIFYDSDNTAYYVDPASTSNLVGLTVANTITGNISGSATGLNSGNYIVSSGSSGNLNTDFQNTIANTFRYQGDQGSLTNSPGGVWWIYQNMRHSNASNYWGTQVAWGWEDNANRLAQRNVSGGSFSAWYEYLNTSGRTYSGDLLMTVSMRAAIFYDIDNTAYYLDPASNTTSMRTNGAWVSNPTSAWGGDVAAKLEYHNNRWYASVNTAFVVRSTTGSEVFWAYNTGVVEASNDFRAPIFYDSNNTAFYADMAGTSEFNTIQTRGGSGFRTFAAGSASISSQLYFADAGNTRAWNWQLDENNNAALWNYDGSSWNKRFTFTAGSGFTAGGSITALVDMRAPIFYDSNNTAYYVDPASGSVLGGQVSFAGGSIVASNGDVYARRSSGATGVYYFADGITKYLYWDGSAYFFGPAGYTQSDVSMRAPIFYDSNNTGFFIDAASTSSLITLLAQNLGVYDSGVANDPYGKIAVTRATGANYSYYGLTRSGQHAMGMGIDTGNALLP